MDLFIGKESLRGHFSSLFSAYESGYKLPASGLRSIQWEACANQSYDRVRWLGGTLNHG